MPIPTRIQATPTLTLVEQQQEIWDAWKTGAHSTGYDLGKGPNTYCARCHSPANWDSQATIDPPPNCVSCKFQNEATPRIAEGNPLISESDWKGIDCNSCHRIENGAVVSGPAWYDAVSGYHETVADSTMLCEKCHTDTQTLKYKVDLGDQIHVGFLCTNCHDPHSLTASCTQSGCHNELDMTTTNTRPSHPTMGGSTSCIQAGCHTGVNFAAKPEVNQQSGVWSHQDVRHTAVSCGACHDAAGLEVGILEGENIWVTFRTVELLGRSSQEYYPSHNFQRDVNCARCHYVDNPWGLAESVGWVTEP
jgi:hypothetical protein